jgi:hypothetical protein
MKTKEAIRGGNQLRADGGDPASPRPLGAATRLIFAAGAR